MDGQATSSNGLEDRCKIKWIDVKSSEDEHGQGDVALNHHHS